MTSLFVEGKLLEKEEYFGYVRRVLFQISNAKKIEKIIIKLHPREKNKSKYKSIAKSLGLENVEINQDPRKKVLYSIINNSDLIVSFTSTADVESLMLDRNVINVEIAENLRKLDYKKATIKVESDNDLTKIVNQVLGDKKLQEQLKRKRKKYVKTAFYRTDGKAYERIADLIVSLIKRG